MDQGLFVGAIYSPYKAAQDPGQVKVLGNTDKQIRALSVIFDRLIEPGTGIANICLPHALPSVDILGMDKYNDDNLYDEIEWIEQKQRIIEKRLYCFSDFRTKQELN